MRAFRPRASNMLDGYSAEIIADWCGVHVSTARRWKRGEEPSVSAQKVFELMSTGNLGVISPKWENWRLVDGKLISPDQQTFTRNDILSLPFRLMQIAHLQSESRLPRQADWIAGEWQVAREIESA